MSECKNKIYIVLGDWSNDGHSRSEKYLIKMNKTKKEMQDAYKASCKTLGISFNHNDDFTGVQRSYSERKKYQICAEYEDCTISKETLEILIAAGAPLADIFDEDALKWAMLDSDAEEYESLFVNEDTFVSLLMWFISYSLEGFKWETTNDTVEVFNGYWDANLNVQLGYGLYD